MQYLVYSTTPPAADAPPPSPELMLEMGKLTADGLKAGVLVATGALEPKGTRLRLAGGQFSVTDGPFIELKELMGGWALLRVNSLEEAIEWSKRFLTVLGEGESEIVRVYGPEAGLAGGQRLGAGGCLSQPPAPVFGPFAHACRFTARFPYPPGWPPPCRTKPVRLSAQTHY